MQNMVSAAMGGQEGAAALRLEALSDEELRELAQHWRRKALRGDKQARGPAHAYEVEMRRRGASNPAREVKPTTPNSKITRAWWKVRDASNCYASL